MDRYKKKSLKFSHELFSRDSRHADTFRARESSRFKRLSMIRSINDSSFLEDNPLETKADEHAETPVIQDTAEVVTQHKDDNSQEVSAKKNEKKVLSRLEMLKKWKEEKLAKQELEKKLKKKPFTAGVSTNMISKNSSKSKSSQNLKSSFINQSTMKFNSSIMGRSRILPPSSSSLKPPKSANNSKLLPPPSSLKPPNSASNSKLAAPSSSIQPSRVPYNFKAAYSASKPASGVVKDPSMMLRKPTTNVALKAVPSNKFASVAKTATTVSKIGTSRSISVSGMPKFTKIKEHSSMKTPNQESSLPKANFPRTLHKPVQKVFSGLPKPATSIAKGIPVRPESQMPVSNIRMKPNAIKASSKPAVKDIPSKNIVHPKSNLVFKKSTASKAPELTACIKNKEISKKLEAKCENRKILEISKEALSKENLQNSTDVKNSAKETASDENIESISDVAFNCDVSLIKPPSSFAPIDFKFRPPSTNFLFDEDPWESLHVVKKYLSRTSTPSKEASDRTSGLYTKETKDFIRKNAFVEDEINKEILCQKAPEKSCEENLSSNFLTMEFPDVLVNNEIMDDMDGEFDKNQGNVEKIASPVRKSSENVLLEKKTHVEQICIDSCMKEISVKDLLSKSLENDPELGDFIIKGNNNEIAPESGQNEFQNVSLEKETHLEQICIDSSKSEINVEDLLSKSLENDLVLDELKTKGNTNEIAPTSSLVSEVSNEISSKKPLIGEAAVGVTSGETSVSENVVLTSFSRDVGEAAESLLKEVKDRTVPVESESSGLMGKSGEPTECCTLEDFKMNDVKNVIESQLMLIKLEGDDVFVKQEAVNLPERKSTGSGSKRISMLKNMSVLNSIAEISELDESNIYSSAKSSKNQQYASTPRRSMRLSTSQKTETLDELKKLPEAEENNLINISVTPRRSTRLHKKIPNIFEDETIDLLSPFKAKKSGLISTTPRRSMRLINLSTPEENEGASCSKSNLTADFERLKLSSENQDPNNLLLDFENSPLAVRKARKISLLYSPDKRKSIRRSIKGDLMSFSPSGS